jgi:hypothetical protein
MLPNAVVEWLTRLLRILEVPDSNIGPKNRLFWWGFVVLLSPSKQMPGEYLKLGHYRFIPHYFQFFIHLSSPHPTWCNLNSEKASLNK